MTEKPSITGVITAMVTPFDADGRLNLAALRALVAAQSRAGVDGVLVCGGSGEYVNLSPEERGKVAGAAIEAAAGAIRVVVGVLEPSTGGACEAARAFDRLAPDALMVLTPYYLNPSPDGTLAHFRSVAQSTSLPIILYNNPSRTGINMSPELLAELGEIDNVVGIKECDRDIGNVTRKIDMVGDAITFLAGDDDLTFPQLAIGARGGIMASALLAPDWAVGLLRAFQAGDLERCRLLHSRITRLLGLFYRSNHPGPLKQALNYLGWDVGLARLPLAALRHSELVRMQQMLDELGVEKHNTQAVAG